MHASDDTSTLPYEKWLRVALVFPPKSKVLYTIRSLDELHWVFQPASNAFPSVNLEHLATWAEEAIGNQALGAFVRQKDDEPIGYKQKCLDIYAWLSEHLQKERNDA